MGKLSRLIPIFKMREDKAAARTGSAIKKYEALNNQLAQIKHYRSEYQNFNTEVPVLLTNAKSFVERLDTSIEDTEKRLDSRRRNIEHEMEKWSAARSRRKAIELLAQRTQKVQDESGFDATLYWQVRCRNADE